MVWITNGTAGGGTGGTGEVTVHGSDKHDTTVPKMADLLKYLEIAKLGDATLVPPTGLFADNNPKALSAILTQLLTQMQSGMAASAIQPNLLYNSTGYRDGSGWLNTDLADVFRDEYVNDDSVHFILTDYNGAAPFLCNSIQIKPNTKYALSFEYQTEHSGVLQVELGYQMSAQLNSTGVTSKVVAGTNLTAPAWQKGQYLFTTPATYPALALLFTQRAALAGALVRLRRIKLEEGDKVTPWVPCYTDWSLNSSVVIEGGDAASFM